jgi:hypothetical protein
MAEAKADPRRVASEGRRSACLKLARAGEEHAVLEVKVALQVVLEVSQSREEGAVGVAGGGRRHEAVGQFAQAGEGFADVVEFRRQAIERRVEGERRGSVFRPIKDGGEEGLLLLFDVLMEFFGEAVEHGGDLHEGGRMAAVDVGDAPRHGVEPGKLRAQVVVVAFDDVPHEVLDRKLGGIEGLGRRLRQRRFEIGDDPAQGDAFAGAGVFDGAAPLAAEVETVDLEYTAETRMGRDEFADAAPGQRCSGG